jgi:hypothetical protein
MDIWWVGRRRAHGEAIQRSRYVLNHILSSPYRRIFLDLLYRGVTVPVNPDNVLSDIHLPSLFRTLWSYTASVQRTRRIRNVIVRITDWIHAMFAAHVTQRRFSLHCSSTHRPPRSISTLSPTPDHYSCTRTPARHSQRIRTRTAST